MGPPQGRAEGEENLPDLLPTLFLMHPYSPEQDPLQCSPAQEPRWGVSV